jgi:hypothetical protein
MEKKPSSSFVHVRIKSDEAIDSKKILLLSQIDILTFEKLLENYKKLRKKELSLRAKLRAELKTFNISLGKFSSTVPVVEKHQREKIKKEVRESEKKRGIEKDLYEIHKRLERLDLI